MRDKHCFVCSQHWLRRWNRKHHQQDIPESYQERKNKLKVMFVGEKDSQAYHYPDCPEVADLEKNDKQEYYAKPVEAVGGRYLDKDCAHCTSRFKEVTMQS